MTDTYSFFATTGKGLEPVLADELITLNFTDVRPTRGGVEFTGSLKEGYRACLWSRVASRILLQLSQFDAEDHDQLYAGLLKVDWTEHLDVTQTFIIDFASPDRAFNHSQFAAQRAKDAIVDQFKEKTGTRPSIDRTEPDIRINVYINKQKGRIALDLSGEALHKRGYRDHSVSAPIKENLAAALLLKSYWPKLAAENIALLDPMCGSGTFLIEAAMIAANIAPGLNRQTFGFHHWKQFQAAIFEDLQKEAHDMIDMEAIPAIHGYDHDPRAIEAAQENSLFHDLNSRIHIQQMNLAQLKNTLGDQGLLITNPPYGERLSEQLAVKRLLQGLGRTLKKEFHNWTAAIITADKESGYDLGIRARKPFHFYNGALDCYLMRLDIQEEHFLRSETERLQTQSLSESAQGLANRIKKNLRTTGKWAKQQGINCYRLYDADIPEYALAIDCYQDTSDTLWVHTQEYQAPKTIDSKVAEKHLQEARAVIVQTLGVDTEHMIVKTRRQQKGKDQYQSLADDNDTIEVSEEESRYLVNLKDHLDTGLFADHRITRNRLRDNAQNKKVLNLFAYTGSFTVKALHGGARETLTIDMSRTYIQWSEKNLQLNGFKPGKKHQLLQADCIEWLNNESKSIKHRFDIIILDPPTFSNSKRMQKSFDIQSDHADLIRQCTQLLARDGVIIFATNFRKFRLDNPLKNQFDCKDISRETLPRDYQRKSGFRHTWEIRHKS